MDQAAAVNDCSIRWCDYLRSPRHFAGRLGHPKATSERFIGLVGYWGILAVLTGLWLAFALAWTIVVFPVGLQFVYETLGPFSLAGRWVIFAIGLLVSSAVPGVLYVAGMNILVNRAIRQLPRPCCLGCGYDLKSVQARCPECGTTISK